MKALIFVLFTATLSAQVVIDGTGIKISSGGSGSGPTIQTNGTPNTSQVLLNLVNSSTNAVGLTLTAINPSGGVERFEITGGSYTGNAATATNLASYPTLCSAGQFSQGLSSGSNNCGTPAGSGSVSGQANGVIPLATASTAIGAQSHMDDGVTTAGRITSTEPIAISGSTHGLSFPAGTCITGASGNVVYCSDATNGYAEANENNTGLSRICTAANGICTAGTPTTVVSTSGSPYSLAGLTGFYWNNTSSTFNWVLDAPTAGKQYCFGNYSGKSGALTITSTTSVYIVYEGTNGTVTTGTLVSGGALGDFTCMVGVDSTHYMVTGAGYGTWTNH